MGWALGVVLATASQALVAPPTLRRGPVRPRSLGAVAAPAQAEVELRDCPYTQWGASFDVLAAQAGTTPQRELVATDLAQGGFKLKSTPSSLLLLQSEED